MRILLDESLPRDLRGELTGHVVTTVREAGWSGSTNGELLTRAREDKLEDLRPLVPELLKRLSSLAANTLIRIGG